MTSSQDLSKRLEEIKKRTPNKTCFDCGEKGTTYAAMDFGTFVCSRCAGLLREINFKVKGTGVSIFKEKEIDLLDKMGNENAKKIWMGKFKENSDKKPDPKDAEELKRFLITKYKDKRFYKKPKKNKSDDDDDEEDKNKKNKGKKKKKDESDSDSESDESSEDKNKKNKGNKKKKEESSSSSSESESDSEEEEEEEEE